MFVILFFLITFATLYKHNVVNLKIYKKLNKRFGVDSLDSYNYVIGLCSNYEGSTPSFLKFLKFFTNATQSRKFDADEQQYSAANVRSTKRRLSAFLYSKGLHLRRIFNNDGNDQTQIFPDCQTQRRHQYYFCHNQEKSLFWPCRKFFRSFSKVSFRYAAGCRSIIIVSVTIFLCLANAEQRIFISIYNVIPKA